MHDAIALFEDEEVYFGEDDKEYYRDNYSLDKVFSKALKGQKEDSRASLVLSESIVGTNIVNTWHQKREGR